MALLPILSWNTTRWIDVLITMPHLLHPGAGGGGGGGGGPPGDEGHGEADHGQQHDHADEHDACTHPLVTTLCTSAV